MAAVVFRALATLLLLVPGAVQGKSACEDSSSGANRGAYLLQANKNLAMIAQAEEESDESTEEQATAAEGSGGQKPLCKGSMCSTTRGSFLLQKGSADVDTVEHVMEEDEEEEQIEEAANDEEGGEAILASHGVGPNKGGYMLQKSTQGLTAIDEEEGEDDEQASSDEQGGEAIVASRGAGPNKGGYMLQKSTQGLTAITEEEGEEDEQAASDEQGGEAIVASRGAGPNKGSYMLQKNTQGLTAIAEEEGEDDEQASTAEGNQGQKTPCKGSVCNTNRGNVLLQKSVSDVSTVEHVMEEEEGQSEEEAANEEQGGESTFAPRGAGQSAGAYMLQKNTRILTAVVEEESDDEDEPA